MATWPRPVLHFSLLSSFAFEASSVVLTCVLARAPERRGRARARRASCQCRFEAHFAPLYTFHSVLQALRNRYELQEFRTLLSAFGCFCVPTAPEPSVRCEGVRSMSMTTPRESRFLFSLSTSRETAPEGTRLAQISLIIGTRFGSCQKWQCVNTKAVQLLERKVYP